MVSGMRFAVQGSRGSGLRSSWFRVVEGRGFAYGVSGWSFRGSRLWRFEVPGTGFVVFEVRGFRYAVSGMRYGVLEVRGYAVQGSGLWRFGVSGMR